MSYQQKYYEQLGQAIALASLAFQDKFDKQGRPYILHCLRVMTGVGDDPEVQVAAILHDMVEDTDWDVLSLTYRLALTERQQVILYLVTHDKEDSYDDYIRAIAVNEDAKRIKLADLKDNSDITRLKGLRKKDFDRLEKYHRAFVYLSE